MSNALTHIETEKRSAERSRSKLVPALRFNEFEGEWHYEFFESFLNDKNALAYGVLQPGEDVEGGVPMLRTVDLNDFGLKNDTVLLRIPKKLDEQYKRTKLAGGELIISVMGTLGRTIIVPPEWNGWNVNRALAVARLNESIDKWFLIQTIRSPKFVKKVIEEALGSAQKRINLGDLKEYKFTIPPLPEQQKIASFLIAVDEKTQKLTKKKALLEQYKKGVMQQLFSGQLRFKNENGNLYSDWEWVGGNELFNNISDKKHNSDLPILAITQDQGAIPRELINYQMTVTEKSVASYKVVQIGDFVISLRTFQGGIEFSDYHGICSPAYIILRPSSDDVDRTYYKFYLKTSYYIKQLQKNLEGIRDGKMISYKYFSEIKIPFPSHPEQQKIATYLSSIDTKIEAVTNQITQTQTFKKGLLQQMFV